MLRLVFLLALLGTLPRLVAAQQPAVPKAAPVEAPAGAPSDEETIRKSADAYEQAFNARDAKTLAAQWAPEAVYVNRMTGERVVGQAAIAAQFAAIFKAQPELKLDVEVASVQLLSPSVAVEHGTAKFLLPKAEPDEIDYTAIHVKRDGKWLLDRVTDQAKEIIPSHYEQLKALEWLVGTWVDDAEGARVETECSWSKNRNFLTRSFTVAIDDRIAMAGMQIVGWDPAAKTIRSWSFDSDGGFSEATWSFKKDRWFIRNQGVLADGRKASAVNVIKPVDDNSFTWQTVERTAGGELLPNIDEIRIVRK